MERAMWSSVTGMRASEMSLDNIANNLSNINTTAFKPGRVSFQDMLYTTLVTPGATNGDGEIPAGIQLGHGTKVAEISKQFTQGALRETGGDLDLAIEGQGFFEVVMPDGTSAYTRDGSFRATSTGEVVSVEGYRVANFPAISNGTNEITITPDGSSTMLVNGDYIAGQQVSLARFANPEGLRSLGHNLYAATEASGPAQTGLAPGENGMGMIMHRYLETSSVNAAEELVNMILTQRAYEANTKAIKASDEMSSMANNLQR
jgi:flagellar basal-body rod protein FlgG